MGRIYDESLTDSTLAFKASEPGTIRYQVDGTASYASAAAMDAASGSAEVTGTISAAAGNGTRDIDVSGLTSGLWYIHLVNNDGTPVSVSFTKIASNVVLVGVGSLQITGNRATIVYDRNVLAQAAGLTLTSHPATVSTGANTVVAAGAASLVITAQGATITLDRNIASAVASLTLTSFAATITNPASGGFTPADLFASSEVGGWYDPSDLSTLWQDTAGTTPVTADGQAVARIDDKSGGGYHWTQATAGSRPLYKTDGTLHWLEFDGTDDTLLTASGVVGTTDPVYGIVAGDAALGVGTNDAWMAFVSGTTRAARGFGIEALSAPQLKIDARGMDARIASIGVSSAVPPGVFEGAFASSATAAANTNVRAAFNGGTWANASTSAQLVALTSTVLEAANGITNGKLPGKIYGALVRNSEVTGTDRTNLVQFMSDKAGL